MKGREWRIENREERVEKRELRVNKKEKAVILGNNCFSNKIYCTIMACLLWLIFGYHSHFFGDCSEF